MSVSEYGKMHIIPILSCLVLVSLVQATAYTRISKPKLNLTQTTNSKSPTTSIHKLPDERRKLSLFPKSGKKFVVPTVAHIKQATNKPMVYGTKKPLMKKLKLQEKGLNKNKIIENKVTRPKLIETFNDNNFDIIQKLEPVMISEEISIEIVEEKSQESIENDDINGVKQNTDKKLKKIDNTVNNNAANVKSVEFTPNKTVVEEKLAKVNEEPFLDNSDDTKNSSDEDEITDLTEFIFVNPVATSTETAKDSSEEVEYMTTEMPEKPKIVRKKRGSNVIEEENLATTVAGYRYTWKDTRLNNDLVFKNINS